MNQGLVINRNLKTWALVQLKKAIVFVGKETERHTHKQRAHIFTRVGSYIKLATSPPRKRKFNKVDPMLRRVKNLLFYLFVS